MGNAVASRSLLVAVLLCAAPMVTQASGKGGLRIICDGEARNAEVTINGKSYGSCPADIEVPAGQVDIKVLKSGADGVSRFHQESFSLGSGALRRVEVVPHLMRPLVSHTKEETVEWIAKKMKQEMEGAKWPDYKSRELQYRDIRVNFRENTLVVELVMAHVDSRSSPSSYIYRIPIDMIERVRVRTTRINTTNLDIFVTKGCTRCTIHTESGTEVGSQEREFSVFDFSIKNSEPGLSERFNDAFQHLKAFREQPRPKTNEKF